MYGNQEECAGGLLINYELSTMPWQVWPLWVLPGSYDYSSDKSVSQNGYFDDLRVM
jgi:hypothetical protein